MTANERIIDYLQSIAPDHATNGEIRAQAKIASHQQVYVATQEMTRGGRIRGERNGNEWEFWIDSGTDNAPTRYPAAPRPPASPAPEPPAWTEESHDMDDKRFELLARQVMSRHYGQPLYKGALPGVPKQFDMVSSDGQIIGDAKYYTLVGGAKTPPAKFSVIAEYVWLMEKTAASRRFLVFGNDIRVPQEWLARYGNLVDNIDFYFLEANAHLRQLR
jgi:hypothetical protein